MAALVFLVFVYPLFWLQISQDKNKIFMAEKVRQYLGNSFWHY